jgi:hypothetical protein
LLIRPHRETDSMIVTHLWTVYANTLAFAGQCYCYCFSGLKGLGGSFWECCGRSSRCWCGDP